MKKISCNIIKDLLPLYLDGTVSSDTKEMAEEHLMSCDFCRKEAENLKKDVILPANRNIRLAEAKIFKNLKMRFWRKKVIASVVSVITVIAAVAVLYSYLVLTKTYIPYDSSKISISEIDGKIYARFHDKAMAGIVGLDPAAVKADGKEKMVTAFYYYETLWSKYIQPIFSDDENENEFIFCLGSETKIDEVYYGRFDIDSSPIDYLSVIEDSELIWDK